MATLAADWPQFRGPDRDGSRDETGILESFPREGVEYPLEAACRRRVVGVRSWFRGRVFVFDVELIKPMARERLHCFEEKTGKVLWVLCLRRALRRLVLCARARGGSNGDSDSGGDRIYIVGANGYTTLPGR